MEQLRQSHFLEMTSAALVKAQKQNQDHLHLPVAAVVDQDIRL